LERKGFDDVCGFVVVDARFEREFFALLGEFLFFFAKRKGTKRKGARMPPDPCASRQTRRAQNSLHCVALKQAAHFSRI
jgi:hypothetical protein